MKARDIVGKKVVRVVQSRRRFEGHTIVALDEIVFDDGTRLRFMTGELGTDYCTIGIVHKAFPKKP